MILLSREVGQGIRLELEGHGEVIVTVGRIANDHVHLEIHCPRSMPVHRGEVFDAIYGERRPDS